MALLQELLAPGETDVLAGPLSCVDQSSVLVCLVHVPRAM